MSTCISVRGEYSSHTTGDDYRCDYCGVFDEDGALEDLASLRRQLSRAKAEALRGAADELRRESRWCLEMLGRGRPQSAVQRMTEMEAVLRNRADQIAGADQ